MLQINDLTVRVAGRVLIDNASVMLPPDARIGFLGRNGTGKSTLFKVIQGELGADSGRSSCRRGRGWAAWRRRRLAGRIPCSNSC